MTGAEGSYCQAHVGSSGPNDDRTRREQARRPAGCAECTDRVQQSTEALRESSCSILATLEAVAELFEHARRGEECMEKKGEMVAVMVDVSRKTLTGVVAGFAAANLLIALTPAPEIERCPLAPHRTGGAGSRTYVQAVHIGPPLLENRQGSPATGPDSHQRVWHGAGQAAPVRPGASPWSCGGIGQTHGKG